MEVSAAYGITNLIASLLVLIVFVAAVIWSAHAKTQFFGRLVLLGLFLFACAWQVAMHYWAFHTTDHLEAVFSWSAAGAAVAAYLAWQAFKPVKGLIAENIHSYTFRHLYFKTLVLFIAISVLTGSITKKFHTPLIDVISLLIPVALTFLVVRNEVK